MIRIPDLSLLMAGDAVPDRLRGIALKELASQIRDVQSQMDGGAQEAPEVKAEEISELAELTRWLVAETVVEPTLTAEEIESGAIPNEDFVMLSQIASRERDTDATGVRIGVEPLDRWEIWRTYHACGANCEACAGVVKEFSTRG